MKPLSRPRKLQEASRIQPTGTSRRKRKIARGRQCKKTRLAAEYPWRRKDIPIHMQEATAYSGPTQRAIIVPSLGSSIAIWSDVLVQSRMLYKSILLVGIE